MKKILLIEDNNALANMLGDYFLLKGYQVKIAPDCGTASLLLKAEMFSAVISDLQLPDRDGLSFFKSLNERDIPFIFLTAFGTVSQAVEAIKEGAFDFLTKPVDPEHLEMIVRKAIQSRSLFDENAIFKEQFYEQSLRGEIIGASSAMLKAAEMIKKVAPTETPVLLCGESGTGKELFARAIHLNSNRRDKPFIAINSAAFPENLLENELFGHEKGSFTDAFLKQKGKLELANGGTFFFDEISELSFNLQAKLLRVLEEKKFFRIGGNREIELDLRFVFATNQKLEELVEAKKFRADLFFRINVYPVVLPPLRERKSDIPLLADFFLKKFARAFNKNISGFSAPAQKKLLRYHWPGNVRELLNTIERAVIICEQSIIGADEIILPAPVKSMDSIDFSLSGSLSEVTQNAVAAIEKLKIEKTLRENNFNLKETARILQISEKTLKKKLQLYEIQKQPL